MEQNGRSIYRTRAGPIPPRAWGATTRRGDTVFVHVLDWADRALAIPPVGARVRQATLLANGERIPFTENPSGVTLTLPRRGDEYDVVVMLVTGR